MVFLKKVKSIIRRLFSHLKTNRILFLSDIDNLCCNTKDPEDKELRMRFPDTELNIFMAKLGKIGQFMPCFAFAPTSTLNRYSEKIHDMGFYVIECPVIVRDKDGPPLTNKTDTVDPKLIDFANKMMPWLKSAGLTHLCLGSADGHFIPLIREAMDLGLGIILFAGNSNINSELRKLVECCKGQIYTLYGIKP